MTPQDFEDERFWSNGKKPGERWTLVVTNLIKLGGLVVALHEAFAPVIRPGALGIAAVMMAGAQSLESFLTSFFGSGSGKR